jgi:hypothetical protein
MTEAEGDKIVKEAYGALDGEEPPRALDEAILAASRRRPSRWRVPLSIAAVLVLAVGVTLRMLPQRPDAVSVALAPQVIETPKPATPVAEPAGKFAQDAPGPSAAAAAAPTPARSVAAARAKPHEVTAQLARAPVPVALDSEKRAEAPAPAAAAPVAGAAQRDAGAAADGKLRALASAPPASGASATASLAESALTPDAWLKRIAELRKQGREREAQESLAEFKKRYPDYKIPEALLR